MPLDTGYGAVLITCQPRKLPVMIVEVDLAVEVNAVKIANLGREADDVVGCGQSVVEDDLTLIEPVFDIAFGPRNG